MEKMLPHKAQANPKGDAMPSSDGAEVKTGVMTPDQPGLEKVFKNDKPMPNSVPTPKMDTVPVAGYSCGKKYK